MEQIFSISQPWSLNGVWTDGGNPDKPAVLFLSAGLLRSQGPNRLYVECARALASQGFSSLRFDLAGIGDSAERHGSASLAANTLSEVQEVLDAVGQQREVKRFVLVGLCSGAYDAIEVAVQDRRVVGVISLDGYSLKSKWYKLHWFKGLVLPRLIKKSSWMKLFNRLIGKQNSDEFAAYIEADDLFLDSEAPAVITERFTELLEREVSLLCLFTGGVIDEYSYCGQLADAAPALAKSQHITEVYYPEMDHLLLLDCDRKKVVDTLIAHLLRAH